MAESNPLAESSASVEELRALLSESQTLLVALSDEVHTLNTALDESVTQRNTLAARYALLKDALGTGHAVAVSEADTTPPLKRHGYDDDDASSRPVPVTVALLDEHSAAADAALAALRQRLERGAGRAPDVNGAVRASVEAASAVRAMRATLAAMQGDAPTLAALRENRNMNVDNSQAPAASSGKEQQQLLERCLRLEAQQSMHERELASVTRERDDGHKHLTVARSRLEECQAAMQGMQNTQRALEVELSGSRDALASARAELSALQQSTDEERHALVASLHARVDEAASLANRELETLSASVVKLKAQRDEARSAAATATAAAHAASDDHARQREIAESASAELTAVHARVMQLETQLEDAALQHVTQLEQLRHRLREEEVSRRAAQVQEVDVRARAAALEQQLAETQAALSTALAAEASSAGARAVLVEKCTMYRSLLFAAQADRGDDAEAAGDALAQASEVMDTLRGRLDAVERQAASEKLALEEELGAARRASTLASQRLASIGAEHAALLQASQTEVSTLQAALSSVEAVVDTQRHDLEACRAELRLRDEKIQVLQDQIAKCSARASALLHHDDGEAIAKLRSAADAEKAAALATAESRAEGALTALREISRTEVKRLQRALADAKAYSQRLSTQLAAAQADAQAQRQAAQTAHAGVAASSALSARLQVVNADCARLRRMLSALKERFETATRSAASKKDAASEALRITKSEAALLAASLKKCEASLRDARAQRDKALSECAGVEALRESLKAAQASERACRMLSSRDKDAALALLASLRAVAHRLVTTISATVGPSSDTIADARMLIHELCDGIEAPVSMGGAFRGDLLDKLLALCTGFADQAAKQ